MARNVYMPDSPEAIRILQGVYNTAGMRDANPPARGIDYAACANVMHVFAHMNGHNDPDPTPYWIMYCLATDAELLQNPLNAIQRGFQVAWFKTGDPVYGEFTDYPGYCLHDDFMNANHQAVEKISISNLSQDVRLDDDEFPEGWAWTLNNSFPNWTTAGNYRGSDQSNFILLDASIPFTFEEESWEPVGPQPLIDERYCTKDPNSYNIILGTRTTITSEEVQIGIPGVAEASYYKTRAYNITAHWTSPVDGFIFNVPINTQLIQHTVNCTLDGGPVYSYNFSVNSNPGAIAQSVKSPLGRYSGENLPPDDYADMTETATMTSIPLTWLKDQASMQKSGVVNNDLFTTIYFDFIDADIGSGAIVETKELDYSSLFGEDIDLSGGTVTSPNDEEDIPNRNRYTNEIGLTTPSLTATGVFNRCYVMDANGVNDLCDYLYNADDSIFEEIMDGVLTRGNPIESLIDLRLYPFDIRNFTGAGTAQRIKFGRTETTIIGIRLPNNANAVIDMGECTFNREYNNFLDYHMSAELYIPFCGTSALPIERILNKKISVKMIVDYITGACTAVVYADGLPIQYRQGIMGISIPMTATNSAEFGKAILGNLIETGTTIASGALAGAKAGGSAMGNAAVAYGEQISPWASLSSEEHDAIYKMGYDPGSLRGGVKGGLSSAGGVLDFASALYNGSGVQQVGSSSPQVSLFQPKQCYLLIHIPTPCNGVYENTFADLVGYACFMPINSISVVANSGFCVFDNVKMDIAGATEAEKAEIHALLTSGIYC